MQTPWGEYDLWDAHVHFFSRRFFESLASESGRTVEEAAETLGWVLPPEDPAALASTWAEELGQRGIGRAAIIASVPGDEASVAAAIDAHPDRFIGYFMVNPLAEDAVSRTRTALAAGLRGVCLFPAMHRYPVGHARVQAVIGEAAARPGAIVFVHCGVLTVGIRKKLGLPSPFDISFSNPIDLHPVALRYPKLNFVIPHFGAGYLREALMLADLCPNVFLDSSSTNGWMRYSGLDLKTVFRRTLDSIGAERLLFGTDSSYFPRGWNYDVFENQMRTLLDLGISGSDARLIFGENLQRIQS